MHDLINQREKVLLESFALKDSGKLIESKKRYKLFAKIGYKIAKIDYKIDKRDYKMKKKFVLELEKKKQLDLEFKKDNSKFYGVLFSGIFVGIWLFACILLDIYVVFREEIFLSIAFISLGVFVISLFYGLKLRKECKKMEKKILFLQN